MCYLNVDHSFFLIMVSKSPGLDTTQMLRINSAHKQMPCFTITEQTKEGFIIYSENKKPHQLSELLSIQEDNQKIQTSKVRQPCFFGASLCIHTLATLPRALCVLRFHQIEFLVLFFAFGLINGLLVWRFEARKSLGFCCLFLSSSF